MAPPANPTHAKGGFSSNCRTELSAQREKYRLFRRGGSSGAGTDSERKSPLRRARQRVVAKMRGNKFLFASWMEQQAGLAPQRLAPHGNRHRAKNCSPPRPSGTRRAAVPPRTPVESHTHTRCATPICKKNGSALKKPPLDTKHSWKWVTATLHSSGQSTNAISLVKRST